MTPVPANAFDIFRAIGRPHGHGKHEQLASGECVFGRRNPGAKCRKEIHGARCGGSPNHLRGTKLVVTGARRNEQRALMGNEATATGELGWEMGKKGNLRRC